MDTKTKIWIMNGVMNAGGAESLIMEIIRNKTDDIEFILVVHSANNDFHGIYDSEIRKLGISIYYLPSVGAVGIKGYIKEFGKLVDEIGTPDIIHSHINANGGIIAKAALQNGIKNRIIHCHADIRFRGNVISNIKNEIVLWLLKKYVNKYGNYYWACSDAAARRLFKKYKDAVIIPNIINVDLYLNSKKKRERERKRIGVEEGDIIVGSVGRIAPIKNYETTIQAIKKIVDLGVKVKYYIYGRVVDNEYYTFLCRMIEQLEIANNVYFMGNSKKINEKLAAFDVFVMPSITEGFGIGALEAQAAGINTLISTGLPREVDMGLKIVKRISPKNVEEWSENILNIGSEKCEMLDNNEIKAQFIKKGYDSKSKCNDIYEYYRQMNSKSN